MRLHNKQFAFWVTIKTRFMNKLFFVLSLFSWPVCPILSNKHLTFFSLPVSCKPTSVKASLRCYSNSAAVTWEPPSGALSYVAVGVTSDGSQRTECNNTMAYCDLSNLQCGQTYNVSVFGHDESCSSTESNKTFVRTGIMSMSGSKLLCCVIL